MEKFLKINAKLRRTRSKNGFVLTLFVNDSLLDKCKSFD